MARELQQLTTKRARQRMTKHRREEVQRIARNNALSGGAETVTDAVRRALRRDVLGLGLDPGARLSIRTLSQRYGAGATPVREALWALVGESLVATEAQQGFRVAPARREQLVGIGCQRQRIEPWLLATAMGSGEASWRRNLEAAFRAFQLVDSKVGDTRPIDSDWEILHRRFHVALIDVGSLPSLVAEVETWYEIVDRYRRLASRDLGATAAMKIDHEALCQLALAGAADEAASLLERHIIDTTARHLSYFASSATTSVA